MTRSSYEFQGLSTRKGFNRSLRHFRFVSSILPDLDDYTNLADVLNHMLDDDEVTQAQIPAILHSLLVDKYGYVTVSKNISSTAEDYSALCKQVAGWTAVDLVVAYFHPDLGILVINPKNAAAWEAAGGLRRNELVAVYAGAFDETEPGALYKDAAQKLIALIEGKTVKTPDKFKGGDFGPPKAKKVTVAPAAASAPSGGGESRGRSGIVLDLPSGGSAPAASGDAAAGAAAPAAAPSPTAAPPAAPTAKKKMTPMIGIPVTNELFHNGNVEAWKRIIQSYTTKYAGLDVYVFYDGERIQDLNTLFKWGKVKHGSQILVSVAGDTPTDVAKLKRYLGQGASHMFEAFLKFPVNTILPLF